MTALNPIPATAGIPARAGSPEARVRAGSHLSVSSRNSAAPACIGAAAFSAHVLRRCDHTFLASGAHDRWCLCCQVPAGVVA